MKKLMVFMTTLLVMAPMFAEEAAASSLSGLEKGLFALGAGVAIGFAALGGGIGQGIAASSAIEGTARNPETGKRLFILMILAFAIIESLVIYALVVSLMLYGKI